MVDGILIDERGETWPENSWALAQRLGYRDPDFDVPSYAVRNLGFIHLRQHGEGVRMALRAGEYTLVTLTAALYALLDRQPRRILLAVFWGEEWSYEMFTSLGSLADRTEELASGEPLAARPAWLAAEKDLAALSSPAFAKVRPLVTLWKGYRGQLSGDLARALATLGLLSRSVLVRRPPKSSRLVVEHFGSGIRMMKPCETFLAIGRDIEDVPDREYGGWVADSYARVLKAQRLRLDAVRATLRTSEATTLRVRYDRLLMPWRRTGRDFLVLSVSIRRELSTVA